MKTHELERMLAAVNPVDPERLEGLDLGAMESDLLADLGGEQPGLQATSPKVGRPRPRRLAFALTATALAAAVLAFVLIGSSGGGRSSRAYGAELVRFAESTPLLLLEGPGWRVQDVYEAAHGPYQPEPGRGEGSMEFVTGRAIPYESVRITGSTRTGERESGMFPPAVRQRRVELRWFHGSLADSIEGARKGPHPHGQRWIKAPVLATTADVDARAEFYVNQGGPGNRQMTAFWSEGGYVLEMKAAVPDLAAFEERLSWLTRVDSQTWLAAMPAKVVKAADHDAAVREMLKGIPVPDGFAPSRIPDEGLTTNRYQVGASVTGIVSCLWFRQWGEARRAHDRAAEQEAERAMATSRRWSILREMAKEGAYPEAVWKLAAEMPSGYREYAGHRWRLLPQAEALGCARWGIPVLPRKQRLQRERRSAE